MRLLDKITLVFSVFMFGKESFRVFLTNEKAALLQSQGENECAQVLAETQGEPYFYLLPTAPLHKYEMDKLILVITPDEQKKAKRKVTLFGVCCFLLSAAPLLFTILF